MILRSSNIEYLLLPFFGPYVHPALMLSLCFPPLSPPVPSLSGFVSWALPHSHVDTWHPHFPYTHAWPHNRCSRQTCRSTCSADPHISTQILCTKCRGGCRKFPPAWPFIFFWHQLVVQHGMVVAAPCYLPAHLTPQSPSLHWCPSSSSTLEICHLHPSPPMMLGARLDSSP